MFCSSKYISSITGVSTDLADNSFVVLDFYIVYLILNPNPIEILHVTNWAPTRYQRDGKLLQPARLLE